MIKQHKTVNPLISEEEIKQIEELLVNNSIEQTSKCEIKYDEIVNDYATLMAIIEEKSDEENVDEKNEKQNSFIDLEDEIFEESYLDDLKGIAKDVFKVAALILPAFGIGYLCKGHINK